MSAQLDPSNRLRPTTSGTADRRTWLGLAVLTLPVFLVSMDVSVLYLAIPSITDALAPSAAQQLWILDIYGFLIAGLLITMGNVGDRVGRRRILLAGAALFGIASVIAAFAPSPEILIAARALMGIGGATLLPLLNDVHPRKGLAALLARWPWMTLKVLLGIYWQALRLLIKRTPVFTHPESRP